MAILCVAAAVGFALLLRPAVMAAGQLSPVAIAITGWWCGLRPALLVWGLATLAVWSAGSANGWPTLSPPS
jgi:hypothetical protein